MSERVEIPHSPRQAQRPGATKPYPYPGLLMGPGSSESAVSRPCTYLFSKKPGVRLSGQRVALGPAAVRLADLIADEEKGTIGMASRASG